MAPSTPWEQRRRGTNVCFFPAALVAPKQPASDLRQNKHHVSKKYTMSSGSTPNSSGDENSNGSINKSPSASECSSARPSPSPSSGSASAGANRSSDGDEDNIMMEQMIDTVLNHTRGDIHAAFSALYAAYDKRFVSIEVRLKAIEAQVREFCSRPPRSLIQNEGSEAFF